MYMYVCECACIKSINIYLHIHLHEGGERGREILLSPLRVKYVPWDRKSSLLKQSESRTVYHCKRLN